MGAVTAAFFITLREGLEAALIVGIIAAYLIKVGRRDALRLVAIGVVVALAVSVVVGVAVVATVGRMPIVVQETFEGLAALLAVVVLTWMLFWMRRQGRAMKGELEASVDAALDRGSTAALVGLAFVAVLREGLETVLFLLAILGATGDVLMAMLWALAGLVVAVGIGYAIFAMGVRINLRALLHGHRRRPCLRGGRALRLRRPRADRGRLVARHARRVRPLGGASGQQPPGIRRSQGCWATARPPRSRSWRPTWPTWSRCFCSSWRRPGFRVDRWPCRSRAPAEAAAAVTRRGPLRPGALLPGCRPPRRPAG